MNRYGIASTVAGGLAVVGAGVGVATSGPSRPSRKLWTAVAVLCFAVSLGGALWLGLAEGGVIFPTHHPAPAPVVKHDVTVD